MRIIKVNLSKDSNNLRVVGKVKTVIQKNGSFVYPTDTVYGLGVNALQDKSIELLFRIKQRPETKPIPVMVKDIEMAKKLAFIDEKTEKILRAVWPGPVTVILEKREIVPDILTAGKGTIGLRISGCQFIQNLVSELNMPITATSANLSGGSSFSSSAEVIKIFRDVNPRPDLILDAGELPEKLPSTILDLTGSHPKILRVGPVSKDELLKILCH